MTAGVPKLFPLRAASHAGSWYTSNGPELSSQIQKWLQLAASTSTDVDGNNTNFSSQTIRGLIVPHAGLSYSGPTAAEGYRLLPSDKTTRIFLIGPSHHYYFRDCALSAAQYYETPLGNIKVDHEVNQLLYENYPSKFSTMTKKQDEDEHSLEMHLPFIYKMMEAKRRAEDSETNETFTLVPILVGDLSSKSERFYGEILSQFLADEGNFFCISSDFCHWGERFQFTHYSKSDGEIFQSIEALDKQGMNYIKEKDFDGFKDYLKKTRNTICGRHPIAVFLGAVEALEKKAAEEEADTKVMFELEWVKYEQSSKVRTPDDSSVSYAAAVCSRRS